MARDSYSDEVTHSMRRSMDMRRPAGSNELAGSRNSPQSGLLGKLRYSLDSAMSNRDRPLSTVEEQARLRIEPGQEIRKGFLVKQGKGILAGTRWRKRYAALYPKVLAYWGDISDFSRGRAPKGVVPLDDCSLAMTDKKTGRNNTFGVFHTTRHDCFFQAENQDVLVGWLESLEAEMGVTKDCVSMADFDITSMLGKGASGRVVQVRKKDSGRVYAMKMIEKRTVAPVGAHSSGGNAAHDADPKQLLKHKMSAKINSGDAECAKADVPMASSAWKMEAIKMEKRILEVVNHPFIVTLHFAFQTKESLCLVMDYVAGGELYSLIAKDGRFAEAQARFYAAELVLALEYLHECGIVYRDLKPENILLGTDGHLLITDFGQSKYRDDSNTRSSSIVGSAYYMAPEIFMKKGHGREADWWSLGVLIYEMLVGLPPCYCNNTVEAYRKLLTEQVTYPDYLSPHAVSLLTGLLKVKPAYRTGGKEPAGFEDCSETERARLKWNMPFFHGVEWDRLL
eukprot:CAMPEP_0181317298 /NCGR_PEP_ID=MMETSP1101-20121128/16394_1 /TAXON_ID=46948 /ORGANISM="Rhodomonas abbreviata, Strain Caron Lab Isolate" /LENGTH=509 /DNA_ID=CAMNT_0023424683 /DNA_START=112 /DNA_END=1637 /DNA_ORIENTATION=-